MEFSPNAPSPQKPQQEPGYHLLKSAANEVKIKIAEEYTCAYQGCRAFKRKVEEVNELQFMLPE